jgi:hypothetical protein
VKTSIGWAEMTRRRTDGYINATVGEEKETSFPVCQRVYTLDQEAVNYDFDLAASNILRANYIARTLERKAKKGTPHVCPEDNPCHPPRALKVRGAKWRRLIKSMEKAGLPLPEDA